MSLFAMAAYTLLLICGFTVETCESAHEIYTNLNCKCVNLLMFDFFGCLLPKMRRILGSLYLVSSLRRVKAPVRSICMYIYMYIFVFVLSLWSSLSATAVCTEWLIWVNHRRHERGSLINICICTFAYTYLFLSNLFAKFLFSFILCVYTCQKRT